MRSGLLMFLILLVTAPVAANTSLFPLRTGSFAGRWNNYAATYTLTRKLKNRRFEGSMVFLAGPSKGQRSEVMITQRQDGRLRITRYLQGAKKPLTVFSAPPYLVRVDKQTLAVFHGLTYGNLVSSVVDLWMPVRYRFTARLPGPGVYDGEWHHYRAIFYLRTYGSNRSTLKGQLLIRSGRFEGQLTSVTVTQFPDGSVKIVRDVGSNLTQVVHSKRPRLFLLGSRGVVVFDGKMTGHHGSGKGRIRFPWSR